MKKEVAVGMSEEFGATPIAHLVQLATSYDSSIYIEVDNKKVNAKSIMGMMSIVLRENQVITIEAIGADEEDAIAGMEEFINKNM